MSRKKFDQDLCDKLKRDRKNLTNKYYRRNVTLKSKPSNVAVESEMLSIRKEIDLLNADIWHCSNKFLELRTDKNSTQRKIRYRTNKIVDSSVSENDRKRYRKEITELKLKKDHLSETIEFGSSPYRTLTSNTQIIRRKKDSLGREYRKMVKREEQKEIDTKTGKPFEFNESERRGILDKINKLGDKLNALNAIEETRVRISEYDKIEFSADFEAKTDYSEHNVFRYYDEFQLAVEMSKPKTIKISGEPFSPAEFNYPQDLISMMHTIAKFDLKYADFASFAYVSLTNDLKNKTISLDFKMLPERDKSKPE